MVQTRRGMMKEKVSEVVEGDEASTAADKGSIPPDKGSNPPENASMPAKTSIPTEEASIESEKRSICGDEEYNTFLKGGTRVPEPSSAVVEEAEEREMVSVRSEEEKEEEKDMVPVSPKPSEEEKDMFPVSGCEEEKEDMVREPSVDEKEQETEEEEKEGETEKEPEKEEEEEKEGETEKEPEKEEEDKEEETAEAEKGGEANEGMDSSETESDEEPVAMEPLSMYFPPSEYNKKIKISTRCHLVETVRMMKQLNESPHPLTVFEKDWFENHPQFKHIFHMRDEENQNHKVMGIWMLLLRTARIDKKKEVWFVVNGVPIRYSLREHALFSGLDCRSYPLNYAKAGSDRFKEKHFKDIGRIRVQDVREKLEGMKPGRSHARLKMLVLYFICTILVGQRKNSGVLASPVDPFLLRAVDDLDFCTKFPWGRFSFDYMLRMISHTMTHFRGVVAKEGITWPVPGFCIPLEFLAFEAIPALGKECIEEIPASDENCPRLCRIRFKKSLLKGWTLQEINDQLGTTREIDSIIPAIGPEKHLLRGIMDDGEEDDVHDVVVDSWMRRMSRGLLVSFEGMYQTDVDSRLPPLPEANVVEENEPRIDNIELVDLLNDMKESMQKQFDTILERLDGIEMRIWVLESDVGLLKGEASGSTSQDKSGMKKKKNKKKKTNKRKSETDMTTHETKANKKKCV